MAMGFCTDLHAQAGILGPGALSAEFSVKDCYDSTALRKTGSSKTLRPNAILKGQRVWRSINLQNGNNRQVLVSGGKCAELGLFEIIKFGLFEKNLSAFRSDELFSKNSAALSPAELKERILISSVDTITVFNADGEETKEVQRNSQYLMGKDIKSFLLKEDWIMNSQSGKQEKHISALAPLVYDPKSETVVPLFWLYYPEWEGLFACFEAKNYYTRERISFREVLNYKYFVSKVDKQSNLHNRDFKTEHRGENNIQKEEALKEELNNGETDLFPN